MLKRKINRIKRKLSKSLDAHPHVDYLLKDCLDDVKSLKNQTKTNKENNKDLKDRVKAMEVKMKIIERLLAQHIDDYPGELLKVYWSLDKLDN